MNAQAIGGEHPGGQEYQQQVRVVAGRDRRLQRREDTDQPGMRGARQHHRREQDDDVLQQDRGLERFVARHAGGLPPAPAPAPAPALARAASIPASSQRSAYVGVNSRK